MKTIDVNRSRQRNFIFDHPGRWQIIFRNLSGRLNFEIRCQGVDLQIKGFYRGKAHDHFQLQTKQHHIAAGSRSHLTIKGAFSQHSRFIHQGLVKIEKSAKNSDARQRNESLLLSPHCYVESQPFLEILNHEVVCSHAVSSAPPNSAEIFFLQSRGLAKKEAQKLIVKNFLEE